MPYQGPVKTINLQPDESSMSDIEKQLTEAIKIVDTIAEADNRSGREIAAQLIIRAGKARAERIKERKAQSSKQSVVPDKSG